jgi:hypothetical protein
MITEVDDDHEDPKVVGRNRGPNEYLRMEQQSYVKNYRDRMEGMDRMSFWRLEQGQVLHEDPDFLQEVEKVSCFKLITAFIIYIALIHSYNIIR